MEEKKLKIINETADYIVVDKPAGLVVNRSQTTKDPTVQDMVEEEAPNLYDTEELSGTDFSLRSGIAHRLDKDTSGLLLIAKTPEFFEFILKEFKERRVEKGYKAVVHGEIPNPIIEINAPIKRSPRDPMKMAVVAEGKDAFTRIELEKTKTLHELTYSLVSCFPKTGRTHQLRVHLSALNNYIAGDRIYCPRNLLEQDKNTFGRMMLHAFHIKFFDPKLDSFVEFDSPLPDEFHQLS